MQKNFQPLIWALSIALLLIVGAAIVYLPVFVGLQKAGRSMETIVAATRNTLSPVIRIDNTIVYQKQAPVLELITHKQHLQHKRDWTSTWAGSTKTVVLEGDFVASGGFNLSEPITVDFDTKEKVVRITHPAPRLIALELKSLKSSESDGWWNRVSDDERNEVMSQFKAEARQRLKDDAALMEHSVRDLHEQFQRLLQDSGFRIEFQQEASPKPGPTPLP